MSGHARYAKYVQTHGTDVERAGLLEDLRVARMLQGAFPGSSWEPMTEIKLIDHLMRLAAVIGKKRWATAVNHRFRDFYGKVGRSQQEEEEIARAHLAAQMMFGLELGEPMTREGGKKIGNIGGNIDLFFPVHNPLDHHLIVDDKTNPAFNSWLIAPEGERTFRLEGWIPTREAQTATYRKRINRNGKWYTSYWVKPVDLRKPVDWPSWN